MPSGLSAVPKKDSAAFSLGFGFADQSVGIFGFVLGWASNAHSGRDTATSVVALVWQ